MLLGTLGASLLGNILAGKGAIATSQGRGVNRAGYEKKKRKIALVKRQDRGVIRAGYGSNGSSIKLDF